MDYTYILCAIALTLTGAALGLTVGYAIHTPIYKEWCTGFTPYIYFAQAKKGQRIQYVGGPSNEERLRQLISRAVEYVYGPYSEATLYVHKRHKLGYIQTAKILSSEVPLNEWDIDLDETVTTIASLDPDLFRTFIRKLCEKIYGVEKAWAVEITHFLPPNDYGEITVVEHSYLDDGGNVLNQTTK